MKKRSQPETRESSEASFKRAKFYYECSESVWDDVTTLVKDYINHQLKPNISTAVKSGEFPKSGGIAMKLTAKTILKALAKAREAII